MNYLNAGKNFIYAKLFNKKTPLVIGWDLTYRCNFRCKYCGIPDSGNYPELSTEEVCSGIAQLRRMGTQRIHFGGGEVLLRDDLGEILALCRKNNITSAVLTNGFRFGERLADLQCADLVKISFDGDEPVHDELRGSGSFKKVIEAVSLARKSGIAVAFSTTLSTHNIDQIDFILRVSRELRVPVKFQTVNEFLSGNQDIAAMVIPAEQRKKVMAGLIEEKKTNKYIINSEPALRYLRDYPRTKKIGCGAGRIYARITPDGRFYPCQMMKKNATAAAYPDAGVKKLFESLTCSGCAHCMCTTTLELNMIYSLLPKAIINGMKKF